MLIRYLTLPDVFEHATANGSIWKLGEVGEEAIRRFFMADLNNMAYLFCDQNKPVFDVALVIGRGLELMPQGLTDMEECPDFMAISADGVSSMKKRHSFPLSYPQCGLGRLDDRGDGSARSDRRGLYDGYGQGCE